jgi:CelD/BcsL family acetyltransferase involved in cellulose biosynthesis
MEAQSPYTVRVVRTLDRMAALETAWHRLAPPDSHPMRQYAWMRSLAEHFCEQGRLRIYVCERDGVVEAIAPLVLRRSPERLEVLGLRETGEPPDVPFGTPAAMEHLGRALAASGIPLSHERVPVDSPAVSVLATAFRSRGWVRVAETDATPAIDLDASWADPEKHYGSNRRSDLRRMRKRAEKEGPVRFEILEPRSLAELERALDIAWSVEAAGWKGDGGSALAKDRRTGSFYRAYARRAWQHGVLRIAFMHVGESVAAMQLVAECDGKWWLLKIGYDERFAKFAPGTLLLMHTIAHAARKGLAAYEFLGNPDSWSMGWARTTRRALAIKAYPLALGSIAALRSDIAASVRRRLGFHARPALYIPGAEEAIEILEIIRFVPL